MAVIKIGEMPQLTPERAMEVFAEHFAGRYQVQPTKIRRRDFVVKKSEWAGVAVRVKQDQTGASFVFTALMPNALLRVLFGGLASYLFLRSEWKALEAEIADFIENAPEFKETAGERAA